MPSLGCWALNEMISNTPKFLANLAREIYEADPICFMRRLISELVKAELEAEIRGLCDEASCEFMAELEQWQVKTGLSRIQ